MVTRRSSSSEVSSPARLFRSTSAFLHTRLAGENELAGGWIGGRTVQGRTVAATDTLDLGQGVDDLLLAVNVGVEQTQDVVEVALEIRSADALSWCAYSGACVRVLVLSRQAVGGRRCRGGCLRADAVLGD